MGVPLSADSVRTLNLMFIAVKNEVSDRFYNFFVVQGMHRCGKHIFCRKMNNRNIV